MISSLLQVIYNHMSYQKYISIFQRCDLSQLYQSVSLSFILNLSRHLRLFLSSKSFTIRKMFRFQNIVLMSFFCFWSLHAESLPSTRESGSDTTEEAELICANVVSRIQIPFRIIFSTRMKIKFHALLQGIPTW